MEKIQEPNKEYDEKSIEEKDKFYHRQALDAQQKMIEALSYLEQIGRASCRERV